MNRILLSLLLAISCYSGYAQVKFDSGYFVTNDGRKNVCLIKNYDWKYNPTEFFYKQSENAAVQKATITDVQEFGVLNFSRYVRFDVDIDTSSDEVDALTTSSRPEFKRESVFLKELVGGKASLYVYWVGNLIRYFLKTDSLKLEQLLHKKYFDSEEHTNLLENNLFRNQLFASLQGPDLDQRDFSSLSYNERSLSAIVERYNKAHHAATESFSKKRDEKRFNLNLRLGADLSGLTMEQTYSGDTKTNAGNKLSARAGLEGEVIMKFNRNKWAIVFGSTYGSYKANAAPGGIPTSVDFKMIEFSAGVREYFFLNESSKLFATAQAIFDSPLGSGTANWGYGSYDYGGHVDGALSFGYKYKNKCSIELNYTLSRDILTDYAYVQGHLHTISLVVGYTLF
jgi:hypothetical protein